MRDSITKTEIAKIVAKKHNIRLQDSYAFLNTIIETMHDAIVSQRDVEFRKFGNLRHKHRPQKLARNVKENTPLIVPAFNDIVFIIAPELKKKINKKTKF